MAGGGVGTGQDKPVTLSSLHPVEIHSLASLLQRSGISFQASQAFALGQPIERAADRRALASIFSDAIAQLRGGRRA
jgi:hypothetical protein